MILQCGYRIKSKVWVIGFCNNMCLSEIIKADFLKFNRTGLTCREKLPCSYTETVCLIDDEQFYGRSS